MIYINIKVKALALAVVTTLLNITACEHSAEEIKIIIPCQTLNFGVLKVQFSPSIDGHHTIATMGGQSREKISPPDLTFDTLQLTPGFYSILISPILTQQAPIEYLYDSVTITQCIDSIIIVPF
jgi:hypothetical protein